MNWLMVIWRALRVLFRPTSQTSVEAGFQADRRVMPNSVPPPLPRRQGFRRPTGRSRQPPELVGYRRKKLLTSGELAFFWLLIRSVPTSHRVFAKVRIGDLIEVSTKLDRFSLRRIQGKFWSKHVDFVLFNRTTTDVDLIIELDDRTHETPERRRRDEYVDRVLGIAGLKILHVQVQPAYDVEAIRERIVTLLPDTVG